MGIRKSIFGYISLFFFLNILTIRADYSHCSNACAYAGLGKKSCYGSGTSPVADLLGYIFRGKTQFFIIGGCETISGLWGMHYKWQQGAQAVTRSEILYGYIVEIPATKSIERTFLVIQITDCPTAFELKASTQGMVPTTNLPWVAIYQVVSKYCNSSYPTECELIQGSSSIYTDTSEFAYPLRLTVTAYLDGLTSFQYKHLYGEKNDEKPNHIAKKYNLDVEQGISDSTLYVEKGTPNGPQYACTNPYSQPGIGRQLMEQNFNVSSVYKPGGLCALMKRIARIFAKMPSSLILGYIIFTIIQEPYDYSYQFNSFYTRLDDFAAYQALFSLC